MNTLKRTEGYSLIEVLVAIAILLLALVGPMTIAAKGIQSSAYVREQTVAISLAQEGVEAFISARNDAAIRSFAAGDLSTSWDWVSDGTIHANCLSVSGCNIDFDDINPMLGIADCSTPENCRLYFDDSDPSVRARYTRLSSPTSEATPYRRVIHVTDTSNGRGVQIDSTVYWNTQLFGGLEQSLTLTSDIYSLYE